MNKTHIHLKTEGDYMDPKVRVIAHLPAIPMIGDIIHLSKDEESLMDRQLIELAKKDIPNITLYYADCLFGHLAKYRDTEPDKKEFLKDLKLHPECISCSDHMTVSARFFKNEDRTFHIELE
jgi:hypothetical protein